MEKLSEGFIDCLERGIWKGHIWIYGECWAGKSYQRNERYVSKLLSMGLIAMDTNRTFKEFYVVTDEGRKLVKEIREAKERIRTYNNIHNTSY